MIHRFTHEGVQYKYMEKANRACIIKDDLTLLWMGDPKEAATCGCAPLAVLLEFSRVRLDRVQTR